MPSLTCLLCLINSKIRLTVTSRSPVRSGKALQSWSARRFVDSGENLSLFEHVR